MEIPPQPCGGEERRTRDAVPSLAHSGAHLSRVKAISPFQRRDSTPGLCPCPPSQYWDGENPLSQLAALGNAISQGWGESPPALQAAAPISSSCSAPALKEPLGWQNQGGMAAAGRCSEPEEAETQPDLKNERFQHPSVPDSSANKQFFFPGCCVSFCLVAAGPCPVQGNGCAAAVWGGGRTQWSASESSGVANCLVSTA